MNASVNQFSLTRVAPSPSGRAKHQVLISILVGAAILTFHAAAQDASDSFMGDWQGSVSIGGQKQPVAVYMIPLDQGHYEARFVADFRQRGPYLYRLRGEIRDGQFRFMDDIPFDVGRITDLLTIAALERVDRLRR